MGRGADEGGSGTAIPEVGEINSSAKGLFRLAQLTGNSSTLAPGACKRCGQVGHLYFQCRNYMSKQGGPKASNEELVEEEEKDEDEPSDAFPSSSDDSDDSDSDNSDEEDSDEEESSDS